VRNGEELGQDADQSKNSLASRDLTRDRAGLNWCTYDQILRGLMKSAKVLKLSRICPEDLGLDFLSGTGRNGPACVVSVAFCACLCH
jgi:hypothetical protein